MKIDEKTLSILGAPKEGFEWVEVPDESLDVAEFGAYIVTRGADVTISHYRQVPIEPEPEVIWGPHAEGSYAWRIRDGLAEEMVYPGPWRVVATQPLVGLAIDYATQHKELKALKEKLGEIKSQSIKCDDPDDYRCESMNLAADLVDMCRNLEVE